MKSNPREKLNRSTEDLANSLAEIFIAQIKLENKINNKKYDKRKFKRKKFK